MREQKLQLAKKSEVDSLSRDMGINGTLQIAGFALSTVALLLAVIACGKHTNKISAFTT